MKRYGEFVEINIPKGQVQTINTFLRKTMDFMGKTGAVLPITDLRVNEVEEKQYLICKWETEE